MNCTDTPSTIGFMAWDYYPFGMLIPNRTYNKIPSCEPVITNQPNIDIVNEEYTGNIGDWQDGDIEFTTPSNELVATAANSNSSVGAGRVYTTVVGEEYTVSFEVTDLSGLNSATLLVYHQQVASGSTFSDITNTADPNPSAITSTGVYTFEFTADEEQSTINLILINSTTGSTFTIDDFVINGTQQIRTFNCAGDNYLAINYRFGFNGKELDSEGMGGGGSTYDYGFRIYNPQIAKFLSVDPLTQSYPWYTPYQFAGNKPIWAIDLDGLEEFKKHEFFVLNNNNEPKLDYSEIEPNTGNKPHGPTGTLLNKYLWIVPSSGHSYWKLTETVFVPEKKPSLVQKLVGKINESYEDFVTWNEGCVKKSLAISVEGEVKKGGNLIKDVPLAVNGTVKSTSTFYATTRGNSDVIGVSSYLTAEVAGSVGVEINFGGKLKFGADGAILLEVTNKDEFSDDIFSVTTERTTEIQLGSLIFKKIENINSDKYSYQFGLTKSFGLLYKEEVSGNTTIGGGNIDSQPSTLEKNSQLVTE
jgi:RHS repeat-associated protein